MSTDTRDFGSVLTAQSVFLRNNRGIKHARHCDHERIRAVAVLHIFDKQRERFSSNATYVASLSAEVAIVSVGKNSFGHPNATVVSRWDTYGEVLQTQSAADNAVIDGDITITTTGVTSFTTHRRLRRVETSPLKWIRSAAWQVVLSDHAYLPICAGREIACCCTVFGDWGGEIACADWSAFTPAQEGLHLRVAVCF